jgi:hypothetical protein
MTLTDALGRRDEYAVYATINGVVESVMESAGYYYATQAGWNNGKRFASANYVLQSYGMAEDLPIWQRCPDR